MVNTSPFLSVVALDAQPSVTRLEPVWLAPLTRGVQAVKVCFNQTYPMWHDTPESHPGEAACSVAVASKFVSDRPGHCVVLNYAHVFHGAREPADVYWWDGATGWGAGLVTEVPTGLPANATKTGTLMAFEDFRKILNAAKDDHGAP